MATTNGPITLVAGREKGFKGGNVVRAILSNSDPT